MKRIWIVVGSLALVMIIGGVGFLGFRSSKPETPILPQAPETVSVNRCDVEQSVTAPGSVINFNETKIDMPFDGKLDEILVKPGDVVKKGQPLAHLDSTAQELALEKAKENLADLTSPEAIANARLAVTSAEADVINAKIALNSRLNWKNEALINDKTADLVLAQINLKYAQEAYDKVDDGYINDPFEAQLFKSLYQAQQVYDHAKFYLSVYSQKPTQRQLDEAQATLDLANAKLTNAQNYLTALTGGDVPTDAIGPDLLKFKETKLALQAAKENLDATRLTAPFDGVILEINAETHKSIPAGANLFSIHNPKDIEIQANVVEEDYPYVEVGRKVELYFDALPDEVISGVVSRILAKRNSGDRPLYDLYISLNEVPEHLVEGMTADAAILIAQRSQVLCLPRAIVHAASGNTATVKVWNGITTEERQIEIGLRGDVYLEILSGLKEGEQVVTR